jgi:pimeloyl-ACP methyl ester carboxylesterase
VPGSIAEIEYLRLGGVDQWVMLRGVSASNPVLIHLHGGPGLSEASFFRCFNSPLEQSFTIVSWDQRGANKSFAPDIPRSSMKLERFVLDLDELVDAVRARVGQPKVAIFGHSWGSVLGALYSARFPDKVAAYVGCAQIGDWAKSESLTYAYALAEAERKNNRKAVSALRAIGPPPHSAKSALKHRYWLTRLDEELGPRFLWKACRALLGGRESSFFDLRDFSRGIQFSMDAMWTEVSRLNLLTLAPALEMPVFLFLGRRDHIVFPETSVDYFDRLRTPSKKLVWFEESGHEPFVDEPEKFNAAMVELVRPVVIPG